MLDHERGSTPLTNGALGDNFAAQSSPSYGGELGRSFEEHNSSREEWEKEKHRGRRAIIWSVMLAVLLVASLAIYFTTRPKSTDGGDTAAAGAHHGRGQSGPAAITVGESSTGDSNIYVNALGTVTPLHTVTLYSQVTGRVMAVNYKEGQLVRKGQTLVEIDPRPYEAALAQAKGTLTHDENVLAEARMDLKRYQDAYARNAVARQQLEDQEKTVLQDEGTVATDQGSVLSAETNLSYCHIISPISGRVGLRLVDPGNTVFSGTGSTLVVITELQPITVVFTVSEDNLPEIQQQMHGGKTLAVDAFDRSNDNQLASGKLTSLDNQIDTTTGTLKFRAAFDNKDLSLFPNQFVNARLLVKTLQGATLVPTSAVQYNGTQAFVYVVKPGASHKKSAAAPAASSATPAVSFKGTTTRSGGQGSSGTPATVSVQNITILTSNENVSAVTGIGPGVKLATSGFDRLENNADALIQPNQPANGQGGHGKSSGQNSTGSPGGHTSTPAGGN
ncbi:membrane fusion protein, multidrug efflux system [Bryocella elongata]|uniref:Membrane fusion protein, multidrug efflux system n=1 Tax=Bryocella elongata TaxID=863522 RepID=A0A1H5U7K5_9BACT|nr:efflux RND transporter periplasmic adaptor subunit [Bryocella elongata]SEF70247.1 membrane fusion protein, multidrug efflux system [Bryocella elongata]